MPEDRTVPNEYGVIPEDEALVKTLMRMGREQVDDAWAVFLGNANDAIGFENWLNASPDRWLPFWSNASNSPPSHMLREPGRRLHNFLASATTLIDHTRNHMRRTYGRHSFMQVYQAEVDARFKNQSLPRFIQELRNYNLHYSLPLTLARLTLDTNAKRPIQFLLSIDILLNGGYDKWTEPSVAFMQSQGDTINTVEVMTRYVEVVNAFHTWRGEQEHILFNRALEAQNGPNSQSARAPAR